MKINKVLSIIQLAVMYTSLICLALGGIFLTNLDDSMTTFVSALFITGMVLGGLAAGLAIAVIITSLVAMFKGKAIDYTKYVMIYKIAAIPYFIGNFVLSIMLIGGMLNPFMFVAIPIVAFLLMSITYINMLSSTAIDFAYVLSSLKQKTIKTNPLLIIGLVLEFFFCVDFLGSIFIFVNNKKQLSENNEEAK